MKIRSVFLIVITVFLFNGCASIPDSRTKDTGDIYRYDESPDICFFPKEQAKWDGYKITNKNWNQLTEYLKLMFIFEGTKELEKNNAVVITINNSARTLSALNYGIAKINKELPKTEISMISFMYNVLNDAKMVTPRKVKR